jgi:fatty-acyl-CoA synthase
MLKQQTVGVVVREIAKSYPNTEAYVYPEHKIRKTYEQFDQETDDLAQTPCYC